MAGKPIRRRLAALAALIMAAAATLVPAGSAQVTAPGQDRPIRLIAGDIYAADEGPLTLDDVANPGRYIVQFDRPVSRADQVALAEGGARVLGYLPEHAFAVRVDGGASIPEIDGVSAIIAFAPQWRVNPRVDGGQQLVRIDVDADLDAQAVAAALAGHGIHIVRVTDSIIIAGAEGDLIPAISAAPGIAWIEPFDARVTHNEEGGAIIGAPTAHGLGYDGSTQIVAVADTGLGDAQEDGNTADGSYAGTDPHPDIPSSRIIEVLDYPGVSGSCNGFPGFNFTVIPDGAQDVDSGHGTHVSGSVLSDGNGSGIGEGVAPAASLVFQATEDFADMNLACEALFADGYYLLGLPDDVGDLFQDAYDLGARVHNNSWGSDVNGEYTQTSVDTDQFMWDNPLMLVVTSAGNSGVDGDSDGEVDDDSMGAPATAKNVLTVGASEGDRADNFTCDDSQSYVNPNTGLSCQTQNAGSGFNDIFTYGEAWPTDYPANPLFSDSSAGNAEQMAAFSSRGPTDDGRIKPDVVGPGTWILSGYSSLYQEGYGIVTNPQNGAFQYDGWGFPYDTNYKYMGGTSMSSPIVSGGAAIVRDYYNKDHGHEASAALTKATLINSANDLLDENNDGVDDNDYPIPNSHEGWGIIDLAEATDGDHVWVDGVEVDTGQTVQYTVEAAGGTDLKITIVWTDYPSTAGAGVKLVNNLDLTVTAPNGVTSYLGNVFDDTPGTGGWSETGGTADTLNNVENVYIQSATAGNWTIAVNGLNVPQGPQPFAVVIEGADWADTEAPVWPGGAELEQTGVTGSTVTVDWSANPATDNVGVAAYDVYVDGALDQTVVGTDATITGLDDSTGYVVKVEARDAGGNATTDGPSILAATTDSTPPTWPDPTISTREVFETSAEVNWEPAEDGVAVAEYTISESGEDIATTSDPSVTLTGLAPETTYTLTVTAHDAAGNSTVGPSVEFTTAPDFADTNGHVFEDDIAWMAARGITLGCGGDDFCPDDPLTRAQMASLIARALGLDPEPDNRFNDVSGVHTGNINAIAEAGISVGCTPDGMSFCPDDLMTRAQMATFMARAFDLLGSNTDRFDDDDGSVHEMNIDAIADVGITLGCGEPGKYCPDDSVTRGQLGAFLHRAFVNLGLD